VTGVTDLHLETATTVETTLYGTQRTTASAQAAGSVPNVTSTPDFAIHDAMGALALQHLTAKIVWQILIVTRTQMNASVTHTGQETTVLSTLESVTPCAIRVKAVAAHSIQTA